ncbi:hypothetical protein QCD60_05795 [Pokkaliibacter sp. MBI-7]|uniref:hypothetical protein n=1 Tax=Pokkaliibacter sp. MBI-7 TaxID=3040600 RepID=UPI00244A1053|nr:hypothetical protein [Pokkaliibacter sp. MBI-7]MDH2432067.1 hypothetical protein [Pokkaliibacter sp. MBI-7]
MKYLIGIGAALLAALWWYHFPARPVSYVEVEFVAPVGSPPLNEVSITSGVDKTRLGNIQPGETKTARLYPAEGSDNQVGLIIVRSLINTDDLSAITPNDWEGWMGQRYYPPGTAFRTHIQIDQNGKVIAEKSCKLPCSFD